MLRVVVGVAGRFAAWCDAVTAALLARAGGGEADAFAADTLAELAAAARQRRRRGRLAAPGREPVRGAGRGGAAVRRRARRSPPGARRPADRGGGRAGG